MRPNPSDQPGPHWPSEWKGPQRYNTDKVDPWEITPLELRRRLDRGEPLVLVDVREPWEAAIASIPGALFLPLNELEYRADEELDPLDEIVLFCHHGVRSMEAALILWDRGYERVKSLAGGIDRWAQQVEPGMARY